MSGGSFYRDPDNPGAASAQANMLYQMAAQMRSAQRNAGSFSDALATTAGSTNQSLTQVMQPIGDSLSMTARQLERLTTMLQKSPLIAGTGFPGQFGGMQMIGAMLGANVALQGMSPQAAQILAPQIIRQNAEIAASQLARSTLTQTVPQLLAAATSFVPGVGLFAAPVVGAASQLAMPAVLRYTGLDAQLARPENAKMLQRLVGDQFGGSDVVGRYQARRRAGQVLSLYAEDMIREHQQMYGGGFFALNAEEYKPLLAAATQMQTTEELHRMARDGGKRLREQMSTLIAVSTDLDVVFDEIAQMGMQFGQGPDSVRQLRTMVDQVNRAAAEGGISSRVELLQFGVNLREQAFRAGQDGSLVAGSGISLVREIARGAVSGAFSYGQLEAFGGRTVQERAQNMVMAVQALNQQVADSGFGRMLRANILAGRRGGDLMDMMTTAGQQAISDPWGMVLSEADPRTNALVSQGSALQLIDQIQKQAERMFGDPRAGAAAALRRLQRMGMTGVQAGALLRFHQEGSADIERLAASAGVSASALRSALADYASNTGSNLFDVLADLREGRLSVSTVMRGRHTLGATGYTNMSLAVDEHQVKLAVKAAGSAKLLSIIEPQNAWDSYWSRFSYSFGYGEVSDQVKDAMLKAEAVERERQKRLAEAGWTTTDVQAFFNQRAGFIASAGVDTSTYDKLSSSLARLSAMGAMRLGISAPLAALLRDYNSSAALADIASLGEDSRDFSTVLESINATLAATGAGETLAQDARFAGILSDRRIDAAELKQQHGLVSELLRQGDLARRSGLATLFANAVTEKANLRNTIDTLVGVIQDGAMNVRNVDAQKK